MTDKYATKLKDALEAIDAVAIDFGHFETAARTMQEIARSALIIGEDGCAAPHEPIGFDEIVQRILGALDDARDTSPEEGESWEGWYFASFDLVSVKIGKLLDELSALSCQSAGAWYRLLEPGDTIQADDEAIADDGVTWVTPAGWEIGAKWSIIFKTMRRRLEAAPSPSPAPGVVEALREAAETLEWASRRMKGNCSGSDVNAVILAASRARKASLSQPAKEREGGSGSKENLETAPANPAQVTDARVEAAVVAYNTTSPGGLANREQMRAAITAAIGAGGQAVAWGFYYDDGSGWKHMVCLQKPTHWNGYPVKNVTPLFTHPTPSGQAVAIVDRYATLSQQARQTFKDGVPLSLFDQQMREMRDEISALAHPVQPGWRLVPEEPTDEMLDAAVQAHEPLEDDDDLYRAEFKRTYFAMLSAAPKGE